MANQILQINIKTLIEIMDQATKNAYKSVWEALLLYLSAHWLTIVIILALILFIAIVEAWLGSWKMLGSILYHYLYLIILFLIGLIFGPRIFASNIFTIAATLLIYPFCYFIVGQILRGFNLR